MASEQTISEKDIEAMAGQHQQMKYQADSLVQQINMVGQSIQDCMKAINTLTEFENVKDGDDILVPIGAGVNVQASLVRPDSVIMEIGAGTSAQKNIGDAKDTLETRKKELTDYQEKMQANLNKIANKMHEIEAVISTAMSQQQQQPPTNPTQG